MEDSEGTWRDDRAGGHTVKNARVDRRRQEWRKHMTDYKTWRANLDITPEQSECIKNFIGGMSPLSTLPKALESAKAAMEGGLDVTTLLIISLYHHANYVRESKKFIYKVIGLLLDNGADVDSRNPSQPYCPLVVVVTHTGQYDLMLKIHEEGGDLNAVDSNSLSGLQHAVANHNFKCVTRLLQIGVLVDTDWLLKIHDLDGRFSKNDKDTFVTVIHGFMDYLERFHAELQELRISRKVHQFSDFLLRFSFDVANVEILWEQIKARWDTSVLDRSDRWMCHIS